MYFAHHRADEAFDMSAVMWPGDGAVEEGDTVFAATSLKCRTMKLGAIVDQDLLWNPEHRPGRVALKKIVQPVLGSASVFHAQRHRQGGRSLDGDMGAENAATRHIDRKAQPWSTYWPPVARIDDDDIGERVIHLNQFECLSGFEGTGCGPSDVLCGLRSQSLARGEARIEGADALQHAIAGWWPQSEFTTSINDPVIRLLHRGLGPNQIMSLDRLINDSFSGRT